MNRISAAGKSAIGKGRAKFPSKGEKQGVGGTLFYYMVAVVLLVSSAAFGYPYLKATGLTIATPRLYYELPQITADLKPNEGRRAYVRIKVVTEAGDKETSDLIRKMQPRIVDGAQAFLRERTREELVGTGGTDILRTGFVRVINKAVEPSQPITILFREIILQ